MDGWFSDAADCASRRNLAWKVWSRARSSRRVFTADDAVETDVAGPEDLGHAAAPDDPVELVAAAEQPGLSHVSHLRYRPALSGVWPVTA